VAVAPLSYGRAIVTPRGRPRVVDCEWPDSWFFAQDANAWSSLAYCVVGLVIGVAVVQRRVPTAFLALAAAITVEGAGSVLYHGDIGDIGSCPTMPLSSRPSGSSPVGTSDGSCPDAPTSGR
jgi:hypothetical protein